MKLIEFIDFSEIFEKVKKNQLDEYPTANDYIEELKSFDEPYEYVEEMYRFLLNPIEDADLSNNTEWCDSDLIKLDKNQLILEWSIGGNDSNEGGDNYWGYGWIFTIDLENELFVDFSFENYS